MKSINTLLNIEFPIVQAPMLGLSTPAMVAAVSNAGGLGSLPVGGLSPEKTRALIKETKALTDKHFAVNLFAHRVKHQIEEDKIRKMENYLEQLHQHYNLSFVRKPLPEYRFYNHLDQIDILIEEQIPIVSYTFGLFEPEVVAKLKARNIKLIGTATSVKEAGLLEEAGMDVIVAQGIEAGGHRGSFLEEEPLPQVGLISLVPQIADRVSIPIIAAGGLFDRRTIKAAFALGAAGVQLGSYFIAANESAASEVYKERLLGSTDTSTELTKAFTGKWARGVKNTFMQQMDNAGLEIPYYTYQNSLTTAIRDYGKQNNLGDIISLWSGQSGGKSKRGSTQALFSQLINELREESDPTSKNLSFR